MIALKCPSCGSDITFDDSREFGFCSYCGTKLQLVNQVKVSHTYEDTLQAELEIVKRLLAADLMVDAGNKLDIILRNHPDSIEANLYRGYVKSMFNVDRPMVNGTTKEEKRTYLMQLYEKSDYIVAAKKLMGNHFIPLYFELKNRYEDIIINKFNRLEESTTRFLKEVQQNIQLLEGYCNYHDSDDDSGFFMHNGQLMHKYYATYYVVNGMVNNTISMTLDSIEIFLDSHKYQKHLFSEPIELADDQFIYFRGRKYYRKADNNNLDYLYQLMKKGRKSIFFCSVCGGEIGPLGCKNKCFFHIKR